jgi:N,N-dimethylformamidase beta subunit-like protein
VKGTSDAHLLVVVPAITWLGADQVDDPPYDGVPNTLDAGGPVQWPRPLVGTGGLPANFADQTAPLLAFLDRAGIAYDVTSDLALALDGAPAAREPRGILLAGPERWTTRGLARHLRAYVRAGGRLASFGTDSLRRGVSIEPGSGNRPGVLDKPTQPTATDPFGARLLPARSTPQPVTLEQTDGDPSAPLLTGIPDLGGFSSFEESAPASGAEKVVAALGTSTDRSALTEVRLGKGIVIRVGLPGWGQALGRADVGQLTHNVADLLRGATPKIRTAR